MSNIYKKAEVQIGDGKYVCGGEDRLRDGTSGYEAYGDDGFSDATYTVDCNVQEQIIIRHARKTAEEIIEEAVEHSNMMYREGYQKGLEEGEKQYSEHMEKAKQILEQAGEEKREMLINQEKEILKLAMNIAEKIIYKKIREDETLLRDMFQNAINKIIHENNDEIRIRMSVDNIDKMVTQDELKRIRANFIPDKRMDYSDCVIETENGTVDATIESRLAQIGKKLGLGEGEI